MDDLLVKALLADRYREADAARLAASVRRNRPRRTGVRPLLRRLRSRIAALRPRRSEPGRTPSTRRRAAPDDVTTRIRDHLHGLAHAVVEATEAGDLRRAHGILGHVEHIADTTTVLPGSHPAPPPAPVMGRRFARAHRALLEQIERCPDLVAALLLPASTVPRLPRGPSDEPEHPGSRVTRGSRRQQRGVRATSGGGMSGTGALPHSTG